MKRSVTAMVTVFVLLGTVALNSGCIDTPPSGVEPPAYGVITEGMNDYVNASNDFSFKMYSELVNGTDNMFFSPYSISTALGMALEGARGKTAEEMLAVLDLPRDSEERRQLIYSAQALLNQKSSAYRLAAANAYWLRQGGKLNHDYKSAIEDAYLAHGEELDFAGDPEGSRKTINDWVEGKTEDKIKDLIPPGIIDALTYLILTNAIYFKSDWKYQFDAEATRNMTFHTTGGGEVEAEMMNMCDEEKELNYAENGEAKLLQLPYKGQELSMFVLLPKDNDISGLESKLDHKYMADMKKDISAEWVDVYLPKFKFELKYELNNYLAKMGMPTAFTAAADFSGIKESGASDLYISKVIHQSFVEVNEEGTEAAAATAVVMREKAAGPAEPQPKEFRADHPFIFLIEHKASGQILFMGKVENPEG